jgi:hypothetical protein
MVDDDIENCFIAGELTSKGYYKKIKSKVDLSTIQFPDKTALGTLSNNYFPIIKLGFTDALDAINLIWINLDLIGDYRYPEDNSISEDVNLLITCFSKGLKVKKFLGAQYKTCEKITEFNLDQKISQTISTMEMCKQFKYSTDPRIMKFWKKMLNRGIFHYTSDIQIINNYEKELIRKELII